MVGACLIAVFTVFAVAAGSASAKDPYNVHTWGQYKYCPYENPEVTDCIAGITAGGSKGGFFEFGKVKVKLNQSITLQAGANGVGEETLLFHPVNGGEPLEAPELKVTGGIGLFNKAVQAEEEWPTALKEAWKEAKQAKETAIYVKIEMAGNECFEVQGCVDTEHLLTREGPTFKLPLKVKVTGPLLTKLGGGPCYIGNDENPIHIALTTEGSGATGSFTANEPFTQIELHGSRLVDTGWHIEPASAPTGCGGAYESYVNASLENVLELEPARTGVVVLQGNLHDGNAAAGVATEGVASGEVP
jgi:hypothetical protein